jgi:hypothetical protein
MGRRMDGNHSPQKNNLTQVSEGNEENGYPVSESPKQRKTTPRNKEMPTKASSKKKSCKQSLRISWRRY